MEIVLLRDGANGKRGDLVALPDDEGKKLIEEGGAIERGKPQHVQAVGIPSESKLGTPS